MRPIDYVLLDRVDREARARSYPKHCPFVAALREEQREPTQRPVGELIGAAACMLEEPFDLDWAKGDPLRGSAYTRGGGLRGNTLSGEFNAR